MTVLGPSAVRAGLSSNRSWMRKRRAQSIPSVSLGSAYRSVWKAYGGGGIATPPLPADRPPVGPADQAGVLGQGAGGIAGLGRLPGLAAAVQLGRVDLQLEAAGGHVDGDRVAVLDQADGAAHGRLGGDMSHAGPVGGPGE